MTFGAHANPLTGDILDPVTGHRPAATAGMDEDRTYTEDQLATWLQTSADHVRRMRERGQGPAYIQPTPRMIRYRWSDISRWLDMSKRQGVEAA